MAPQIGQRFGRLTIKKFTVHKGRRAAMCSCDCGSTTVALLSNMQRGNTTSCGCVYKRNQRMSVFTSAVSEIQLAWLVKIREHVGTDLQDDIDSLVAQWDNLPIDAQGRVIGKMTALADSDLTLDTKAIAKVYKEFNYGEYHAEN